MRLRPEIARELLRIAAGDEARGCEIHDWPSEGLALRLVTAMRERHGKGGIQACRECLLRAKASLPPRSTENAK